MNDWDQKGYKRNYENWNLKPTVYPAVVIREGEVIMPCLHCRGDACVGPMMSHAVVARSTDSRHSTADMTMWIGPFHYHGGPLSAPCTFIRFVFHNVVYRHV